MYDKDGDGEISVKELTTVMRCLGLNPSESEIVEIMANLDLDGKQKTQKCHPSRCNVLRGIIVPVPFGGSKMTHVGV